MFKGVDQLIKSLNLKKAVEELSKAKEIDPHNGYIKAFEERIAFLTDEGARQNRANATRKQMEDEARKSSKLKGPASRKSEKRKSTKLSKEFTRRMNKRRRRR